MDSNRFRSFNKTQQLLMLGSEFARARAWQGKDEKNFLLALERALELIDLIIPDSKWKANLSMLLGLREETTKFYTFERKDDVEILYNAL